MASEIWYLSGVSDLLDGKESERPWLQLHEDRFHFSKLKARKIRFFFAPHAGILRSDGLRQK
jgi:hypothetical protein